jgi:hypothetical protein
MENKKNIKFVYKNSSDKRRLIAMLSLIAVITCLSYLPSLNNGFTNWDDDQYVTNNNLIRDYSSTGIEKIFTSFLAGNYHPLTVFSLATEFHFVQQTPFCYHFTNLVIHLVNCILVFFLIFKIGKNDKSAFLVALLFAIHPLHVESVAWISARKDVLYTLFFLSGLLYYIKYLDESKKIKFYFLSLLFFILSCLSKGMAVTLPIILLLIDFYRKRKINKKLIIEKILFFLVALMFGIVATIAQKSGGAIKEMPEYTIFSRLFIACYGILFYLFKMVFPINLSCFYPYSSDTGNSLPLVYLVSPLIVSVLAGLVILSRKNTRKILFGSAFFLISIIPVLQILPVGNAVVADRYFYVSSIGLFFLVGEGFAFLCKDAFARFNIREITILCSIIVLSCFSYLTFERCQVWNNSISLLTDVIKKYPDVAMVDNNIGLTYVDQGNPEKGIQYFQRAAELAPNDADPYINMADTYLSLNQFDKAIVAYKEVINRQPNADIAYYNIGVLYGKIGKDSLGLIFLKKAAMLGNQQSCRWLIDNGHRW